MRLGLLSEPSTVLLYFFLIGGSKPSLVVLAVFGVLRLIQYLKSGKDMVAHTRISEWYSRMKNTDRGRGIYYHEASTSLHRVLCLFCEGWLTSQTFS